jgi:hypothetical protein
MLKLNYNSKPATRKHNTEAELKLKNYHQKTQYWSWIIAQKRPPENTILKMNYNSKTTTREHNAEAKL